jgi:hypothetical protein
MCCQCKCSKVSMCVVSVNVVKPVQTTHTVFMQTPIQHSQTSMYIEFYTCSQICVGLIYVKSVFIENAPPLTPYMQDKEPVYNDFCLLRIWSGVQVMAVTKLSTNKRHLSLRGGGVH